MSDMLPFPLNKTSTQAANVDFLGKIFTVGGRSYRLVKNSATMTAPKFKPITYSYVTGGASVTWATVKIASATTGQTQVAGICVVTTTGNVTAGSYFFVQRTGDAQVLFGTTVAANEAVGTGAVTTYVGCAASQPLAAGVSVAGLANHLLCFGRALVAVSAADLTSGTAQLVRLEGII